MLADDAACNSRNRFPGCVYANAGRHLDLYGDNIEVDYRGYEVTVENFLRVLTGMYICFSRAICVYNVAITPLQGVWIRLSLVPSDF